MEEKKFENGITNVSTRMFQWDESHCERTWRAVCVIGIIE